MTVPNWVYDAIFYQIFPDRFANGNPANDPENVQPWGAPPAFKGFQGGDLVGIQRKLDYLSDLGANAIYLNPIFLSASNHRYDTIDYFRIDPRLGSNADFHSLIDAAHRRGIRIILDGVFNHCARGFFAFNDLLENENDSGYKNWFHVRKFPLRAYDPGQARNYEGWWGYKSLPKLNTANPAVRRYLFNIARYWIEQGADGWRMDVPNEIDDDDFWAEFRQVVRQANPDAYLLGEIWDIGPRWVDDAHFDGIMNYPARSALLGFLTGDISSGQFAEHVESLLTVYPPEHTGAMYNLLGSHDTERVMTRLGSDANVVALAFLFMFAYPGIPSIYYGDEIGLEGGKDPDCRRAFPWDDAQWNHALLARVKKLAAVRQAAPELRRGEFSRLLVTENTHIYAFARSLERSHILVILNASSSPTSARIPVAGLGLENGRVLKDLLGGQEISVSEDELQITLNAHSGVYLR